MSHFKAVDSDVVATDSRIRIEYLEDNSTDVGLIEAVDDNMEVMITDVTPRHH